MKKKELLTNLSICLIFVIPFSFLVMIPLDLIGFGENLLAEERLPYLVAMISAGAGLSVAFVLLFWGKLPLLLKRILSIAAVALTVFALS